MITTRIRAFGLILGLGILAACAAKPTTLDLRAASDVTDIVAIALVHQADDQEAILTAAGVTSPGQQAYIMKLVPEVLADLTLFGPEATALPRDVRIVVVGDGAEDAVISQRALPLYRTLGNALVTGSLRRLDVADRVLESRIAAISANAIDQGREINGATVTVVLKGLTHDGDQLIVTSE